MASWPRPRSPSLPAAASGAVFATSTPYLRGLDDLGLYRGTAENRPTTTIRMRPPARRSRSTSDPGEVSYPALLDVFWHAVDRRTTVGQSRPAATAIRPRSMRQATSSCLKQGQSKQAIAAELGKPIVTEILAAPKFWPAEDYHQTITRRTRCATPSTGTAAAATRASKRCGAPRRTRASRRTETLLDGVKRPANFAPRT